MVMGRAAAAELLRRLLQAKLSRHEPDPLGALARVEATALLEEKGGLNAKPVDVGQDAPT
jgi:hypothetical protein